MANVGYAQAVNQHYGAQNLGTAILAGLQAAGKDIDRLTYTDLSMVDQFHTRGKEATLQLAVLAELRNGLQILDVGGGLGGPARPPPTEFGCHVTVLDLTEEYCRVGEMLTARTGLSDQVVFKQGSALSIPFSESSFDVVWTQHSSMNIEDKARLYVEIQRVLRPGGHFALYEIMAGAVQPIYFPVPWAAAPTISFLQPASDMRTLLRETGFREVGWKYVSKPSLEWFQQRATAATGGARCLL